MKLTKKKKPKKPVRNRTPKSAQQKTMSLNIRHFPTELVWKMRKKAADQQMSMKEFIIQTFENGTTEAPEKGTEHGK